MSPGDLCRTGCGKTDCGCGPAPLTVADCGFSTTDELRADVLERENERLRARVVELESELAAAYRAGAGHG